MAFSTDDETLSRAVARFIARRNAATTGRDVLRGLPGLPDLSFEDGQTMLEIVTEDRENDTWDQYDLR